MGESLSHWSTSPLALEESRKGGPFPLDSGALHALISAEIQHHADICLTQRVLVQLVGRDSSRIHGSDSLQRKSTTVCHIELPQP